MAADKYKIGDRVIVVSDWKQSRFRRGPRVNHLLGSIVTITSICERVLEHKERERFYCFAEAFDEGHMWDDTDIAGLAPMLPRLQFDIEVGKDVVLLARDKSDTVLPGTIARIDETHFYVQEKWSLKVLAFRKNDFVCDDANECCRVVVYETKSTLEENQQAVRLQYCIQQMFQRFAGRIPTVEDLEHIVGWVMQKGARHE